MFSYKKIVLTAIPSTDIIKNMENKSLKKRIFEIIQIGKETDTASRIFDIVLAANIVINVVVTILCTFDELSAYATLFNVIDAVTTGFFLFEYILRLWTAHYLYPELSRGRAVLKFALSIDGIIMLLCILPMFFLDGLVVFRMLRVVRIFHLFMINSRYDSFNVIMAVLKEKKNQLLSSYFILIILTLAASVLMYNLEHEAQPDVFRNAFSGIWWSASSLLTIGYGDIYPVTAAGRVVAIFIDFLGICSVALPTGIISAGFVESYRKMQRNVRSEDPEIRIIDIDIDSSWIGMDVDSLKRKKHAIVIRVSHNGRSFVPDDDYKIKLGDTVTAVDNSEGT